jgi:hypothetical protein
MIKLIFAMITILMSTTTFAAKDTVKVKGPSKAENFDSQLVEGQIYRPDLSVVTGDTDSNSFGVIRMRANFDDHAKNDKGEVIKSEAVK